MVFYYFALLWYVPSYSVKKHSYSVTSAILVRTTAFCVSVGELGVHYSIAAHVIPRNLT